MEKRFSAEADISIEAEISDVWDALINPKLIKKYLHDTEVISDWEVGSPIRFTGVWKDKPYEDKGTILKMEENKLLQYTWLSSFSGLEDIPENYSTITYRLSEGDDVTLLALTQDNIATEEAKINSEKNWSAVLENLKKLVEDDDEFNFFII